jgi:hypothetical protein
LLGLASLSSCVSLKRLAWMLRSKQGGAEQPVVLFRMFQCVMARKKTMQKAQRPCQKINSQIINVAFLSIDFLKNRIHDF